MSHIIPEDQALLTRPFDRLPPERLVRIFGVPYASLRLDRGGEFFITRFGWARMAHILPDQWYTDRRFCTVGAKLPGSTGMVYRVPTEAGGRRIDLVVKFSRFAQDVPFSVEGTFPDDIPRQEMDEAYWNNPFEEFGSLMDLRRGRFGPSTLRIRTKQPLCIYCPHGDLPDWQLGRHESLISQHEYSLEHDQAIEHGHVHLHPRRQYILVYEWLKGLDAEGCFKQGMIDEETMKEITYRSARDMAAKGFMVLDHKPRHVILRPRQDGRLLMRDGRLVYGIIDFELLQRTSDYVDWLRDLYGFQI